MALRGTQIFHIFFFFCFHDEYLIFGYVNERETEKLKGILKTRELAWSQYLNLDKSSILFSKITN